MQARRRKKRKCWYFTVRYIARLMFVSGDLARPSCSLCQINGWICEYRHVKKKPGPPRSSFVRRSRPSKSGIESILCGPIRTYHESTNLTILKGQPEELATPPPDAAQSTNWGSNLPISTFEDESAPQPVDITSSSASTNIANHKDTPFEQVPTLSVEAQATLCV